VKVDTIAAIATPSGSGGIGIVRVSGPDAAEVLARVVGRDRASFRDRVRSFGVARDARGERLDEVLYVWMRGPRSFTGEDVAEIHGHGGAVNMGRLYRATLAAGARAAEPGEFSRRAFASGRLDLTRAEAVLGVIEAASERACRVAQAQLEGALGQRVRELGDRATALRAEVEAGIDFPGEDLELLGPEAIAQGAEILAEETGALAATFALGRALRDGAEVALRGPVNSGKSSIFNSLIGRERALVAEEPGTTRDFVEAGIVLDGVAVTLIDTAGDRAAESEVERRGIALGSERAAHVDLEVVLHSAEEGMPITPPPREARRLHVVSKADLVGTRPAGWLATSAHTGDGLDELRAAIVERVVGRAAEGEEGPLVTSERQRALLLEAAAGFAAAAGACRGPLEIVADELRVGGDRLAAVLGEDVSDEMLDQLFARFCIGK
jgi:tRNA modification GTPase